MDTYIKDNPLIVTLFYLLILIYCFVVLYGRYLQRKKYNPDVTKMSKEEIDSLSDQEKSLILNKCIREFRESPGSLTKESVKKLIKITNAFGGTRLDEDDLLEKPNDRSEEGKKI
jgi:hypothetical protein